MKEEMTTATQENQIVIYQPNQTLRLEVKLLDDTVWLNRQQLSQLFGRDVKTIGKHIANALKEELSPTSLRGGTMEQEADAFPTVAKFATVQMEGNRRIVRHIEYYSLEMITSVGFRVKSEQGIVFRRWANRVLKEYLLRGYAFNSRMNQLEERIERKIGEHTQRIEKLENKVDFFVQTSLPPVQGIFYDGQLWDARSFVEKLIAKAKASILLIDNYVDVGTLDMLAKKCSGVKVELVTSKRGNRLAPTDVAKFAKQYGALDIKVSDAFHDRFLILDDKELYLIGASLKDLGAKCFAFTKLDAGEIVGLKARI